MPCPVVSALVLVLQRTVCHAPTLLCRPQGSLVVRRRVAVEVKRRDDGSPVVRERTLPVVLWTDIIRDDFWNENPELLLP